MFDFRKVLLLLSVVRFVFVYNARSVSYLQGMYQYYYIVLATVMPNETSLHI